MFPTAIIKCLKNALGKPDALSINGQPWMDLGICFQNTLYSNYYYTEKPKESVQQFPYK